MSSVRRRLLAAVAGAAASSQPVAVGNPAVAASNLGGTVRVFVDTTTPATGSGTLTTVNFYAGTAGVIYAMTGTVSGANFTVRAISDALVVSAGVTALTVSLAVAAGDFIGYYSPSVSGGQGSRALGVGTRLSATTNPGLPTPGSVLSLTSGDGLLSMNGTN